MQRFKKLTFSTLSILFLSSCQSIFAIPHLTIERSETAAILEINVEPSLPYSVSYLVDPSWSSVAASLSLSNDPTHPIHTVTADAHIDTITGRRSAKIIFPTTLAGTQYNIDITLKVIGSNGIVSTVANFSRSNFTITSGTNSIDLNEPLSGTPISIPTSRSPFGGYVSTVQPGGAPAGFIAPLETSTSPDGTIYVADKTTFRRITVDSGGRRSVSTIAGNTFDPGSADGDENAARFTDLIGIAEITPKTFYVSDNCTIRKISLNGIGGASVTTIAGGASSGNVDGEGKDARFGVISGITSDPSGNLYAADSGNGSIRKVSIDASGNCFVSTLVGDSDLQSIQFSSYSGIAFNQNNELIFTTTGALKKVSWNSMGKPSVSTIAGSDSLGYKDGIGTSAKFFDLQGVVVDEDGTIYVVDERNRRIRKIVKNDQGLYVTTTLAGGNLSGGVVDGPALQAGFSDPLKISILSPNRLIVSDGDCLRLIDASNPILSIVSTLAGRDGYHTHVDGPTNTLLDISDPTIVVSPDGFIFSQRGNTIVKSSVDNLGRLNSVVFSGNAQSGYLDGVGATALFNAPRPLGLDRRGSLIVWDSNNYRIRRISVDAQGNATVSTVAGCGSPGVQDGAGNLAGFNLVRRCIVDSTNDIYLTDGYRIRKIHFLPSGGAFVSTLAGQLATDGVGYLDGSGSSALFADLGGLALDGDNTLYVVDEGNSLIRKLAINSAGDVTVSTAAGVRTNDINVGQGSNFSDGRATQATFFDPYDIIASEPGVFYVTDKFNVRVRKISTDSFGQLWVTTLAGSIPGFQDGPLSQVQFYEPIGLGIDGEGNLYVSDGGENGGSIQIRKIFIEH